ncbi:hypothetical protein BD309DRAFT_304147 [Dichomitus squalens]|uniref:Uncharacterized protein n=1 Tax=Dichomitus squalens TaxID=114155 RepID=A0A4Q9NK84_9APHY|nr:hypothetical protein BD309DRAFT_304147 [Dichomitus squalens]TBU59523.1 hypothetical protein BD310DRAFT_409400 [Dichomitus squalens]
MCRLNVVHPNPPTKSPSTSDRSISRHDTRHRASPYTTTSLIVYPSEMQSSATAACPKSCLRRPSVFTIVDESDSNLEAHAQELSSSSTPDEDSIPKSPSSASFVADESAGSRRDSVSTVSTTASDASSRRASVSTVASTDSDVSECGSPKTRRVSFSESNSVRVFEPEPYQPEPKKGPVASIGRACVRVLQSFSSPSSYHTYPRYR